MKLFNYNNYSDSLSSLLEESNDIYEPGGEETGNLERWKNRKIEVKKFVEDVSACEKTCMNDTYN